MSHLKIVFLSMIILGVTTFSACDDDDPVIPNEEEVITTLTFTLTPEAGGTPTVLTFTDLDGDGGNAPVIVGGNLLANTVYDGSLQLLNESDDPVEDINPEIIEEGEDHQFFFSTSIADLSVAYNDTDAGGKPIGLSTKVTTSGSGSGTFTVILRHEPDKSASGVIDGNIANAGGETDIEVEFDVQVQ